MTETPATTPPDFEHALGELEATVEKLEHGDLSLEDALKHFERGVALARDCQASLKQAEQKVEILLQKSATAAPEPFEGPDGRTHLEGVERDNRHAKLFFKHADLLGDPRLGGEQRLGGSRNAESAPLDFDQVTQLLKFHVSIIYRLVLCKYILSIFQTYMDSLRCIPSWNSSSTPCSRCPASPSACWSA